MTSQQVADAAASTRQPSDVLLARLLRQIDDSRRIMRRLVDCGQFGYANTAREELTNIFAAKLAYDAAIEREANMERDSLEDVLSHIGNGMANDAHDDSAGWAL